MMIYSGNQGDVLKKYVCIASGDNRKLQTEFMIPNQTFSTIQCRYTKNANLFIIVIIKKCRQESQKFKYN